MLEQAVIVVTFASGAEPISLPSKCMKLRHVNTFFCLKSQFESITLPVRTGQSGATY